MNVSVEKQSWEQGQKIISNSLFVNVKGPAKMPALFTY